MTAALASKDLTFLLLIMVQVQAWCVKSKCHVVLVCCAACHTLQVVPAVIHITSDMVFGPRMNNSQLVAYTLQGSVALLGPEVLPDQSAKLVTLDFGYTTKPLMELPVVGVNDSTKGYFISYVLIDQLVSDGEA